MRMVHLALVTMAFLPAQLLAQDAPRLKVGQRVRWLSGGQHVWAQIAARPQPGAALRVMRHDWEASLGVPLDTPGLEVLANEGGKTAGVLGGLVFGGMIGYALGQETSDATFDPDQVAPVTALAGAALGAALGAAFSGKSRWVPIGQVGSSSAAIHPLITPERVGVSVTF